MKGAVSVVIATFGDRDLWDAVAEPAVKSVHAQVRPVELVRSHGDSLHTARNFGAEEATGEWLIFLDADDELAPDYAEQMLAGVGDIRQPSTLGIVDGVADDYPVLIPRRNLLEANFLVIGSMIRRSDFLDVGGFDDYPILEDWALFLNLWVNGASIGAVPEAVYKVHVTPGSRNNGDPALHGQFYAQIRQRFTTEAQRRGRSWV